MSNIIPCVVGSRLTLRASDLQARVAKALIDAFTHRNIQHDKLKRMGYSAHKEPRYICTAWEYPERDLIQVPRGGAERVREVLKKHGLHVKWVDKRQVLPPVEWGRHSLELRDNQLPGAQMLVKKQQGLLLGQTGTGKTETTLGAALMTKQPTMVVVWNKDLQKQWIARILKYNILPKREIGGLGGVFSTPKHGKISVVMQQSLVKHWKHWKNKYGTVILDEAQRAPAETYGKCFNHLPAKYRFACTADEKRPDGKHFITYDVFGDVVYEMESNETILEPTIYAVPTRYADARYEDDKLYTAMITRLLENKTRNDLIESICYSRLKAGRQVLLFTDRVDAALYWVSRVADLGFVSGPLVGGETYAQDTTATLNGLRAKKVQFAACTSYADVGLDVPSLDCGILTCPSGEKRMNQQIGRIRRQAPGKRDCEIWYLWDRRVAGLDRKLSGIRRKFKNVQILEGGLGETEQTALQL